MENPGRDFNPPDRLPARAYDLALKLLTLKFRLVQLLKGIVGAEG